MLKKLISISLGTGMLLVTVSPAFAVNGCGNQTTGASSINTCVRNLLKTHTLTVSNTSSSITHNLTATAVSGDNNANQNTNGGSVAAGGALASTAKQASLNTGLLTFDQTDPASDDTGVNDTTGFSSINSITFNTQKTLSLTVNNSGTISQTVASTARSGGNNVNMNTVGGTVTTGDSVSDTTVISILNDFVINVSQ